MAYYVEGGERGGVAVVGADFFEDVADVDLGGLEAHAEDGDDLVVGLALRDPEQDLGLAGREHERTPKPGGDRRRVEPRDSGLECGGNRRATPLWLCWRSKSEDEIAD